MTTEDQKGAELADEIFDRALAESREERTITDLREWITERKAFERRDAPKNQNTPAAGMTMGALEILDALTEWLNGDDDA